MKYIITESKLAGSIGKYLKMRFPYVKGVRYSTYPIKKFDGEIIDKNVLEVVIDPYKVGEGNIAKRWEYVGDFGKEVVQELNKTFKLNLGSYGTEWEVIIFTVRLDSVR
jgi:hypothetical protein